MIKCLSGICVSLLLLIPSADIDAPPVQLFPKAEDSWGRPVWYNTLTGRCEDAARFDVSCPPSMKLILNKPE